MMLPQRHRGQKSLLLPSTPSDAHPAWGSLIPHPHFPCFLPRPSLITLRGDVTCLRSHSQQVVKLGLVID